MNGMLLECFDLFVPHFQLDPLDQAKLDLMSAYALNSMFWSKLLHLRVLTLLKCNEIEQVMTRFNFPP